MTARLFPWETFNANVDELIQLAGSAEKFCLDVGISYWTLLGWRNKNARSPSWWALDQISEAFGVTIDDLTKRRIVTATSEHPSEEGTVE